MAADDPCLTPLRRLRTSGKGALKPSLGPARLITHSQTVRFSSADPSAQALHIHPCTLPKSPVRWSSSSSSRTWAHSTTSPALPAPQLPWFHLCSQANIFSVPFLLLSPEMAFSFCLPITSPDVKIHSLEETSSTPFSISFLTGLTNFHGFYHVLIQAAIYKYIYNIYIICTYRYI